MYECIYIYVYICIYVYIYIYVYVCVCICICICIYLRICICIYLRICISTHIYRIYAYLPYLRISRHIYIYLYTYTMIVYGVYGFLSSSELGNPLGVTQRPCLVLPIRFRVVGAFNHLGTATSATGPCNFGEGIRRYIYILIYIKIPAHYRFIIIYIYGHRNT